MRGDDLTQFTNALSTDHAVTEMHGKRRRRTTEAMDDWLGRRRASCLQRRAVSFFNKRRFGRLVAGGFLLTSSGILDRITPTTSDVYGG